MKLFCLLHILLRIKYVPLQRCFAKGTNYIAQLSTRTATSNDINEQTATSNDINEQTYIHGVCALGADSSIVCRGCRRPEWIYGRGLRFLYAFELVLSPQNLDERINNKYKMGMKATIVDDPGVFNFSPFYDPSSGVIGLALTFFPSEEGDTVYIPDYIYENNQYKYVVCINTGAFF